MPVPLDSVVTKPAYPALFTVLRAILAVAGTIPWLLPPARAHLPLGAFGRALDLAFLPFCHRLEARTLSLYGIPMPLCSRCAGMFAGIALGALLAWPAWSMRIWRPILLALTAIMLIEIATQDLGLHPVFHPTRIATGALLGYAMAASFAANLLGRTKG